jgi:cyanophycinase
MSRCGFILFLLCLSVSCGPADTGVEIYRTGATGDRAVDPEGGLLLLGGGGEVDSAMRWFLGLARGGDVVVLRASGSDGYNAYFFEELGVELNSVTSIVFQSRAGAESPEIAERIRQAEAIFLAGGDQSRYWNYWKGTRLLEALNDHLAAGKPFGGTSAGLAVLGEFAYVADHREDLTSAVALRDPHHAWATMSHDFLRAPLLAGVLTDSHFAERGRLGRLVAMLAQVSAEHATDVVGIGVDERTALCIDETGTGWIESSDGGNVYLVQPLNLARVEKGKPLEGRFAVVTLDAESRLQFPGPGISEPKAVGTVAARSGRLRGVVAQP